MSERQATFERSVADYDEKLLTKSVDFDVHRFITVERDGYTGNHYVKGHRTLRAACDHLARAVLEGETFVPEHVLDLDTGERHELDMFVFVAPKEIDAVAVMLPRVALKFARDAIERDQPLDIDPQARTQTIRALDQALERKRSG